MSARQTTRRTAVIAATGFAAAMLIGSGPAAAHPPSPDHDACTHLLDQVTVWPGTLSDGSRHFSDGYESYLLRREPCIRMP